MRRFVGLCYINFSPLKSMEFQLSLEKKNNVIRPKLIENERNEVLNFFTFSKKKSIFFKFWKSPEKNSSKSCFFWKDDSISKWFKIISNHFLRFLKASLENWDFTLNNSETLNATILLYAKSSHLKTKVVIINLNCGTRKEHLTVVVKFSPPPGIWPVQESHSGKGAAKGDLSKKALWNSGRVD